MVCIISMLRWGRVSTMMMMVADVGLFASSWFSRGTWILWWNIIRRIKNTCAIFKYLQRSDNVMLAVRWAVLVSCWQALYFAFYVGTRPKWCMQISAIVLRGTTTAGFAISCIYDVYIYIYFYNTCAAFLWLYGFFE